MGVVAYFVLLVSVALTAQALFSLYLMLYTWEHPERLEESRGPRSFLPPRLSFTVLLPARHEEAVIYQTIKSAWSANYPSELLEVVMVCHESDDGTIAEAERAIREIGSPRIRVETFSGKPINKPRGLNVGLQRTGNEVVTIFDAEDDIDPEIFNVVNTVMLEEEAGVVQSGVQLMNFRDHWFSVHNCLEYFFWFKSRLHFHAKVGMIPLGGNTVFMRRSLVEQVGGWDADCLTEDAEIGLRISALGEKIRVVYHAQHVTREETPDSVASFVKQRTRWHQGFLQILRRGSWLKLSTFTQKLLAFYTLSYSVFQGLVMLLWPLAIFGVFLMDVPVGIAMISFLPLYALSLQLLVTVVGMFVFAKEYGLKASIFTPVAMTLTFLPFQFLLGISAVRAMYREARNQTNWEKTAHFGAHRRPEISYPTAYESLLDDALGHLSAERGSVMVLDAARQTFTIESSRGLPDEVVSSTRPAVGQGVAGWVAQRNRPIVINGGQVPEGLDARLNQPGLKSSIVMPVRRGDEVVAVLNVSSDTTSLNDGDLIWLHKRLDAPMGITEKPASALPEPRRRETQPPRRPVRAPAHKSPRTPARKPPSRQTTEQERFRQRPSDVKRPGESRRRRVSDSRSNKRRSGRAGRRTRRPRSSLLSRISGISLPSVKPPSIAMPAWAKVPFDRPLAAATFLVVCGCVGVFSLIAVRDQELPDAIAAPANVFEESLERATSPPDLGEEAEKAPATSSPDVVRRPDTPPARPSQEQAQGRNDAEAPPRDEAADMECEDTGTRCLIELAATEAPSARYVGGRIETNASGERRNVLYFEDPTLDRCGSAELSGTAAPGVGEYVMIIVGEDFFADGGESCAS